MTALVHETWFRLGGEAQPTWDSRAHFFGAAAEGMRRILVEKARRKPPAPRSAALVLGLVASISQALRANRAERTAQQEAAIAGAVNEFLVTDLLRQADSSVQADSLEEPNPDLKVREALDRAAQKVGTRFAQQPLVEAQVRAAIGESYLGIGLPAQAVPHLLRAHALRESAPGAEHPDTLAAKAKLARGYFAEGKLPEAATLQNEILAAQTRALGDEQLAIVHERQNRSAEAVALRIQALDALKRVLGPEHPRSIATMVSLGPSLLAAKNFADAKSVLRELLAFREKTAPDVWSTFNTRSALGGAIAEAEPFLVSSYEGMRQREARIPPSARVRLQEALERLVQFYSAWDRPDATAAWQTKLDEFERTSSAMSEP